ncbi:hypothetical protein ACIBEA_32320 [Streptomyces sp. NPDC051555]|uniref:hypothetical protein n=1 Tax=Streptomyces sp. NPDC051555 TaxID=3365657 RepID=UPI00379DE043
MSMWWDVVPDEQRQRWTSDPFVRVGPLRFGMRPDEVSAALSDVTAESQRYVHRHPAAGGAPAVVTEGDYREFGLKLYYREGRLAAVVVDALRGPQVSAGAMALVGRVPSVVERWLVERAEAAGPRAELSYLDAGVPGSDSLGVVIDVQRAGDGLLTRPVFVPEEALDDLPHFLPAGAWSAC